MHCLISITHKNRPTYFSSIHCIVYKCHALLFCDFSFESLIYIMKGDLIDRNTFQIIWYPICQSNAQYQFIQWESLYIQTHTRNGKQWHSVVVCALEMNVFILCSWVLSGYRVSAYLVKLTKNMETAVFDFILCVFIFQWKWISKYPSHDWGSQLFVHQFDTQTRDLLCLHI